MIISAVGLVLVLVGLGFAAGWCFVDGLIRLMNGDREALIAFALFICVAAGAFSEYQFLIKLFDLYQSGVLV